MSLRLNSGTCHRGALAATLVLSLTAAGLAQSAKPIQSYPAHLPYSFSNFVWLSNDELRGLLKERILNLGDEIAPTLATEARMRETLKGLLKEKGIPAEVQSEDPSTFSLSAERVPGAPGPAIVFSLLSPQILVDKVVISQAPDALIDSLGESLRAKEGREYSGGQNWLVRSNAKEELTSKGYLEADVDVEHGAPRRDGDHFVVNLLVSVKAGPQYRISTITADGGVLLQGRDLSSLFCRKDRRRRRPRSLWETGGSDTGALLAFWLRGR